MAFQGFITEIFPHFLYCRWQHFIKQKVGGTLYSNTDKILLLSLVELVTTRPLHGSIFISVCIADFPRFLTGGKTIVSRTESKGEKVVTVQCCYLSYTIQKIETCFCHYIHNVFLPSKANYCIYWPVDLTLDRSGLALLQS